ncbi:hypothetical protein ACE7GA_01405 [Roseomonas sp. CCTCC AB2023176]|uniref:hypothetical protein n=1 Tax=Roseomonas sp. CCTCC AB2023176 TaxID=3342640 RepID=UPI0035D5F528
MLEHLVMAELAHSTPAPRARRRGALAALAALVAAPTAAPDLQRFDGPVSDADLLAMCQRWLVRDAEHRRLIDLQLAANDRGDHATEKAIADALVADVPGYLDLADSIFQIQPRTREGLRAQARVLTAWVDDPSSNEEVAAYNFAEYVLNLLDGRVA